VAAFSRVLAGDCWVENGHISQDFNDGVPANGSSLCLGPMGMKNINEQLLIEQVQLERDDEAHGQSMSPSDILPELKLENLAFW
jgi:hypothetical protein